MGVIKEGKKVCTATALEKNHSLHVDKGVPECCKARANKGICHTAHDLIVQIAMERIPGIEAHGRGTGWGRERREEEGEKEGGDIRQKYGVLKRPAL